MVSGSLWIHQGGSESGQRTSGGGMKEVCNGLVRRILTLFVACCFGHSKRI